MFRADRLAAILLGGVLAALPGFSQESGRSEVSVQAFGSFVTHTTSNGVPQTATDSGGVLANYRYFFTPNLGVEVNYGYSRNTESYDLSSGRLGVDANQDEVTGAFVYRHRFHGFVPFAEAGVGGLVFDPRNFAGASSQARAAFVYGAGADFNLTQRVFLRAEYRGFVYDSPTFGLSAVSDDDRITHRAEPSIGFGYRF